MNALAWGQEALFFILTHLKEVLLQKEIYEHLTLSGQSVPEVCIPTLRLTMELCNQLNSSGFTTEFATHPSLPILACSDETRG